MASSSASTDYFPSSTTRPPIRPRPGASTVTPTHAASPLTPLLNRSISSQYNSPSGSSFRNDQEEQVIYELGARHFSAGFAGESRPRCIHYFNREDGRRVGDYRACEPGYQPHRRKRRRKLEGEEEDGSWSEAEEVELYRNDVRALDLGLVEDKLERVVRGVHTDYLQLDQKLRKALLVIPSLLPTPVVEIALKVLFQHYAQPPAIALLTTPLLACVGAGVRDGLVVDVGWQETVVTAVGEYKQVSTRRTVRAGKRVVREMAMLLEEEVRNQLEPTAVDGADVEVTFAYADEVTRRMAWCRPQPATSSTSDTEGEATGMMKIPSPLPDDQRHIHIPFTRFSKPSETAFFPPASETTDDHDLPLPQLLYRVLLALPPDLRASCTSRIIITGGLSNIPGLKARLLHELSSLITSRGWDAVNSYGSAAAWHAKVLVERSANIDRQKQATAPDVRFAADKKPIQDGISHGDRIHDDVQDPITKRVVTEMRKGKVENVAHGAVRGVETLGVWSGASLLASLRVKGVHEVEREDFLKHGLRDDGAVSL